MPKTKGADSNDYGHYMKVMTPYLQRGCSIHEACKQTDLPYRSIMAKCERDQKYLAEIEALQDVPVVMARKVWLQKIQEGDYVASRDYLRAKRKDEFSEKVNTEMSGGMDVAIKDINID